MCRFDSKYFSQSLRSAEQLRLSGSPTQLNKEVRSWRVRSKRWLGVRSGAADFIVDEHFKTPRNTTIPSISGLPFAIHLFQYVKCTYTTRPTAAIHNPNHGDGFISI